MPLFQSIFSSTVYAQNPPRIWADSAGSDDVSNIWWEASADFIRLLETINKWIYILLRPSLAVGWAALWNDLVYWKAFFLDRSLWKFWQMMRTFSNYILWFLFIGSILMAFFKQSEDPSWVKKLFKRLVLAWILLNFSRWMVAAMIDLSTIWVVAIWWLPLTVMWSETDWNTEEGWDKIRFLKTHTLLDMAPSNDKKQDQVAFWMAYSCEWTPDRYYLPCYVINDSLVKQNPVWEEWTWAEYKKQSVIAWEEFNKGEDAPVNITEGTVDDNFCVFWSKLIKNEFTANIWECSIYERLLKDWVEEQVTKKCSMIWDLATNASWSTWPLYTLYASLFHMSWIWMTNNFWNLAEVSFEMLMKAIVWIALLIPLLALAIVLVIRVVFLWMIIAFSPLLVMAYVFEFKGLETMNEWKFKIWTIVWLIFLPVFAVFALSISVVFLSILWHVTFYEVDSWKSDHAQEQESQCKNDPATILKTVKSVKKDWKDKCYEFMWIQTICFDEWDRVLWSNIVNIMSWLVLNFFGIALMWTVLFAVLKSNAITKSFAENIDKLAKQWMMSLPVIPIWKWWTSIWWMKKLADNTGTFFTDYQQKQFDWLWWYMDHKWAQLSWAAEQTVDNITNNAWWSFLNSSASWEKNTSLMDSSYQRSVPSIVDHINSNLPAWATAINKSSTQTMRDLMNNSTFQQYADAMDWWDGKFQERFLWNWDKTDSPTAHAEMSQAFAEWLWKAAQEAWDSWFVYPGVDSSTGERLTHWSAERHVEYIQANGVLKRLQWKKTWWANKRWYIDRNSWVKTYRLPTKDITNASQLRDLWRLISDEGGWDNVPEFIKKQYTQWTKLQAAITKMVEWNRVKYATPWQIYTSEITDIPGETAYWNNQVTFSYEQGENNMKKITSLSVTLGTQTTN